MIELIKFVEENVKIEDIEGNILTGYVFSYDDGTEEDDDSPYYNVPYIWIANVKPIKGKYILNCELILSAKEIKTIEIIK